MKISVSSYSFQQYISSGKMSLFDTVSKAKELGFEASETAFIGDSDTDMLTGNNAKMFSVGCSWGYRPREVLAEAGADVIIDAPAELTAIFS